MDFKTDKIYTSKKNIQKIDFKSSFEDSSFTKQFKFRKLKIPLL